MWSEVCDTFADNEQTNEEWLHTLNTEQLADILLHIADSCYWAGFFKGKEDADGYDDDYCLINQNIVEWLKQPHSFE